MSKLGNYISVQNGYAFKSKDFIKNLSGMPVIKIGNVTGGSFIDLSSYDTISEEIARKVKSFQTKDDDILIAMTGANVGKVSRIAKGTQPCLINQRVGRFILKEDCPYSSDFIYYLVSSNKSFQYFSNTADGAAQPNISGKLIEDLEFPDISPKSANKAGKYLKVLDEKIQLNTQINQTLEQIAQALFKSWFVDFDPVRAKAQALSDALSLEQAELATMQTISGKTAEELTALLQTQPDRYAELAETAKAFPCEMVEVDGVEVPKEWEVKRIDEVIQKIPVGKKYSSKTAFSEGLVPILDQGRSGVIGYHNDKPGVKASIEDPIIVFANHTCYMRLISYDFSAIQNVFAFKGKECNLYWLYLATLGKQEFVEYKGHFPDFLIKEIIVPPEELTELFGKYVKESFSKIFINDRENSNLAKIRDLLLPKLLNGGIQNE